MENSVVFKVAAGGLGLDCSEALEGESQGAPSPSHHSLPGQVRSSSPSRAEPRQGDRLRRATAMKRQLPQAWTQHRPDQSVCVWLQLGETWGKGSDGLMRKIELCIPGIRFFKSICSERIIFLLSILACLALFKHHAFNKEVCRGPGKTDIETVLSVYLKQTLGRHCLELLVCGEPRPCLCRESPRWCWCKWSKSTLATNGLEWVATEKSTSDTLIRLGLLSKIRALENWEETVGG